MSSSFPPIIPWNPVNQAGPEELKMIQYFRDRPGVSRWDGRLEMNGNEYLAYVRTVMRIEKTCRQCMARPEDCPKSLLQR